MKRKIIFILITIALIAGVVAYYFISHKEENNLNITMEDDVINIYFFYGDGCPHCAEEEEFFESIEEEYKGKYKIYMFETWYNKDNVKLLEKVAASLGDTVSGVPYTVIGSTSITGYSSSIKDKFISAIETEKNSDIVYNVIKENAK